MTMLYDVGSLAAEIFQIVLGLKTSPGRARSWSGLTSGSLAGAFDLDFVAYKEGVFAPTPSVLAGDSLGGCGESPTIYHC